jgi:hypothetical protein
MTQDLHSRPNPAQDTPRAHDTPRDDTQSRHIQHDINRTRADMNQTLDQLGNRLRPSNLLGEAVGHFTGSRASHDGQSSSKSSGGDLTDLIGTAAKTVGGSALTAGLLKTVRRHPVLAAGIGGAVAYLALRSGDDEPRSVDDGHPRQYGGSYVDARTGKPYDVEAYEAEARRIHGGPREGESRESWLSRIGSTLGDAASSGASALGSAASSAAGAISSAASAGASATASGVSQAAGAVGSAAGTAHDQGRHYAAAGTRQAGAYGRSAYEQSRRGASSGAEKVGESIQSNPLAAAVASLAAGVLAGLVVPRTQREDQLMGGYSRDVKDQASDLASEAYERGRTVAEAGLDAAKQEAERRGLTPEQLKAEGRELVEQAKTHAAGITDAAKMHGQDVLDQAKSHGQDLKGQAADTVGKLAEATDEAIDEVTQTLTGGIDAAQGDAEQTASDAEGRARTLADDSKHKANDLAEDAQASAKSLQNEVEARGLTPSDLADDAKSVVAAAKDAAADEAERQKNEAREQHGS